MVKSWKIVVCICIALALGVVVYLFAATFGVKEDEQIDYSDPYEMIEPFIIGRTIEVPVIIGFPKIDVPVMIGKTLEQAEQEYYAELERQRLQEIAEQERKKKELEEQMHDVYIEASHREGMHGRLFIPDIGVNVALFTSSDDRGQAVTDAQDSAWYFSLDDTPTMFIADHWNQGFGAIKQCIVGETEAYIITCNNTKIDYICTASFPGHNLLKDMTDNDYNSILNTNTQGISRVVPYTCNGHWKNIWIVYFDKID